MMLTIMTWLWRQTPDKGRYFDEHGGADKVNVWAAMMRRNLTIEHELVCVTDEPEGIDPSIRIVDLPRPFDDVIVKGWRERIGAPQCYRRLTLFHPEAAKIFGAERFVSMDLDCVITGNLDRLFDNDCPFVMFKGTSKHRPYNGSMIQMNAGARRLVWETFALDPQGVADAARRKYIGSDQAVISMVLGKGEERWDERDGVVAYGGGFLRRHGRHPSRVRLSDDVRLVFFPGRTKPWDLVARAAFVADHWHDGEPRAKAPQPRPPASSRRPVRGGQGDTETLYAYDDRKQWGRMFKAAADRVKGCRTKLFIRESRVPPHARAFVRVDQQGAQRDVSRGIVFSLYGRGVITLPTYREAIWYDDKVAQLEALRAWLPETVVVRSKDEALGLLDEISAGALGGFPFVSKAAEGAASSNVRLIRSAAEAELEVSRVFEGRGLELNYGRRQSGYVYWQRLVPDQDRDYRVCIVGDYLYGLVRKTREDSFTASGSGSHYPLTLRNGYEARAASVCVAVAKTIGTRWAAFDVVFESDGTPVVLELSSAWTMKAYKDVPVFTHELAPTSLTGANSFRIAVDVLRELPELDEGAADENEPERLEA